MDLMSCVAGRGFGIDFQRPSRERERERDKDSTKKSEANVDNGAKRRQVPNLISSNFWFTSAQGGEGGKAWAPPLRPSVFDNERSLEIGYSRFVNRASGV